MPQHAQTAEQVGAYYDDIGELVEVVGGNLHLGYWPDESDTTPMLGAMNRLTHLMEQRLQLRPGQHLLDLGCGVGEPALRIAQRNDVTITGVTISAWQVAEATRRLNAAGLRGRVRIEQASASDLPYGEASFDAVLAFDSMPNSDDKPQWMREMFRVLRPGGRLVFSEYPADPGITEDELATLRCSALFSPPAIADAAAPAVAAGFEIEDTADYSEQVRRTYTVFFDKFAEQRDQMVAAYGAGRMAAFERDVTATWTICGKRLGYVVITARKPGP